MAAEAEAPVKADLPEVDLLAQDQGLAHQVELLEVVAPLLRPGFLEAYRAEVVPVVVVRVDPAERLEVRAAVAARIPLRIPRMAKFPTRRLLARNPTR